MEDQEASALAAEIEEYLWRWPGESRTASLFMSLLRGSGNAESTDAYRRERLDGHFTASAWLVDRGGSRILLTHHRKLGLWLQPGGHADGDRDLARVALREAGEETGLRGLQVVPGIFDLDRHWIPEYGDVPAHWHYDVRYVVRAGSDETYVVGEESHALAWRGIVEVAADASADASVRRMAEKWLAAR